MVVTAPQLIFQTIQQTAMNQKLESSRVGKVKVVFYPISTTLRSSRNKPFFYPF